MYQRPNGKIVPHPLCWMLGAVTVCNFVLAGVPQETSTTTLRNGRVALTVELGGDHFLQQTLSVDPGWASTLDSRQPTVIESDGDFALEVMYTDWRAPHKENNADNPVTLTKDDFAFVRSDRHRLASGEEDLTIVMRGKETPFRIALTYALVPDAFYIRRKIAVSDTAFGHHFLRRISPVNSVVGGITKVVKEGEFGQPAAFLVRGGGGFSGLETPLSANVLKNTNGHYRVSCGEEYGELISANPLESDWAVEAVTPDSSVKRWFFSYLNDIRVAPLRPYTLYNSWYDLRSPEYPHVPRENVMGETSAMKMVQLLRTNMIEKHGIPLDAFVLDDGWDVYRSDWVLRKDQFPHGLKVLADELKETGTSLGLWIGPIGGYSFRDRRVGWMKEHGYEVVGDEMCVAGTRYHDLLRTRVSDFVKNEGVAYFKWDGIQFSCSEPDHGHPVDVYSRRAVLNAVIDLCNTARKENPSTFLNITSGTWLSPWWVKFANTIWMDGEDYGYADVPSISKRDAAITYRDFVLYDDFHRKGLWFPIANLMTHGIIKGKLEYLGAPDEPLDKFTDDALLYVARGVAMYELYISPDILTEGEWNSLSRALAYGKANFPILRESTMIGGNPMNREPYGYVHFKDARGIVAVRNPCIQPASISVDLSTDEGLDPGIDSLVLERVYPTRWISPELHRTGDHVEIPLEGYETAVYEIYPLTEANLPLFAGVDFDEPAIKGTSVTVSYHPDTGPARLLNPRQARILVRSTGPGSNDSMPAPAGERLPFASHASVLSAGTGSQTLDVRYVLSDSAVETNLEVLLTPERGRKDHPAMEALVDGIAAQVETVEQEGPSQWYSVHVQPGSHTVKLTFAAKEEDWKGSAGVWLIGRERLRSHLITYELQAPPKDRILPPRAWPESEIRRSFSVGSATLVLTARR